MPRHDPDPAVRAQAWLALGQTDDDRARARIAEALRFERDPLQVAHLASATRNAIATAPPEWISDVALPFARRRIASSDRPEQERARWETVLRQRGEEGFDPW